MLKTALYSGILGWFLFIFIGCGIDAIHVLEHPSAAKPGETITVNLANMFFLVATSSRLDSDYDRDSLHVSFGLPPDWSVVSIDHYVAQHYKILKSIEDTSVIKELRDSLNLFQSRAPPLVVDNAKADYFKNKNFTFNSGQPDSFVLNTDSIGSWNTYSSVINLHFPAGMKMDTVGLDTTGNPFVDTIGVSAVPIYMFATLKAGSQTGTFNLYYYSNTGSMNDSGLSALDASPGDLTYYTISITKSSAISFRSSKGIINNSFSMYPNPFGSSISLSIKNPQDGKLIIFNQTGKYIREFEVNSQFSAHSWDGTDSKGKTVPNGIYFVHYQGEYKSFSTEIVKID